jgi:hypothetical protein
MRAALRGLALVALLLGARPGACQSFVYVDAGIAACPAAPVPTGAAPKTVRIGAAVPGSIKVSCGFDQGSYTVRLNATDPGARFSQNSFLVNFGRVVGSGTYTVTFATAGVHRVSAAITPNMGSPALQGRFASAGDEFNAVPP